MDRKYRILIVDDDENIKNIYKDIFESEGFEVDTATDGMEGMERSISGKPDIVFTGIIMPRMDGFSLKEELSKNVATANIPVFMSSHMGRTEDMKKAQAVGIKDFFVVGMITPKEVVAKVRTFLGGGGYRLRIHRSEADAYRLGKDMGLGEGFTCPVCGGDMLLELDATDMGKREFSGKFRCPKCG